MANEFWTSAALEPKRGYRFIAFLGNMTEGASYYIKSVNKPGIKVSTKEHKYMGHNFWYPGMVEWTNNPTEIKLVDPVSPDASFQLAAILQASGFVIPNGPASVTTISKQNAVSALNVFTIYQINESFGVNAASAANNTNSNVIEKWSFNNAWIEEVTFGDLAYDKEDLTEITLKIRWDWATIEAAGGDGSLTADLKKLVNKSVNKGENEAVPDIFKPLPSSGS